MGKWIFYQQCMCSRKNWTSTQMPVSPVTSATRTCIWHLWVASRLNSVPTNAILLVLFQCLIMHNFKFAKYNCTNNKAKIKSSRSSKIGHLQISWFRINPAVKLWGKVQRIMQAIKREHMVMHSPHWTSWKVQLQTLQCAQCTQKAVEQNTTCTVVHGQHLHRSVLFSVRVDR